MKKTLVVLAEGFEETEAITIIDFLRRANIETCVASLYEVWVTGSHDITIKSDQLLDEVASDDFDMIILPGGQPGTNNLKKSEKLINILQMYQQKDKYIAAICAAPTVLAAAGVAYGKNITSYPSVKSVFTHYNYLEKEVVVDGKIITSRGVGTAIDFSLELVKIIKGQDKAAELAKKILH